MLKHINLPRQARDKHRKSSKKRERGVFCRDPKRFLTVAETMHAVSIGYDWFFHELSERCALN
jgi:hypothetical protein